MLSVKMTDIPNLNIVLLGTGHAISLTGYITSRLRQHGLSVKFTIFIRVTGVPFSWASKTYYRNKIKRLSPQLCRSCV